jgi:hypothetical protein
VGGGTLEITSDVRSTLVGIVVGENSRKDKWWEDITLERALGGVLRKDKLSVTEAWNLQYGWGTFEMSSGGRITIERTGDGKNVERTNGGRRTLERTSCGRRTLKCINDRKRTLRGQ